MDPNRIEAAITPRTKAIMPVHNNGLTCEMGPIMEIARKHHLLVIVDSCQTLGSTYQGSLVDTLGDIAALSFVRNKAMTCGGEGGMVVTDDAELAYRCQLFANHGRGRNRATEQDAEVVGLNYRLSEILAAIGRVQLKHLDDWNHQRRANAAVYEELFAKRDLPLELPPEPPWGYHTRMRYVIRAQQRNELVTFLKARGIQAAAEYPVAIHLNRPYVKKYGYTRGAFPITERSVDEVMVIPIWPGLSRDDQEYVVDTVEAFYRLRRGKDHAAHRRCKRMRWRCPHWIPPSKRSSPTSMRISMHISRGSRSSFDNHPFPPKTTASVRVRICFGATSRTSVALLRRLLRRWGIRWCTAI